MGWSQAPKTVTVTVTSGAGYSVGASPSATGTIIDAQNPPAPLIFADPAHEHVQRWLDN